MRAMEIKNYQSSKVVLGKNKTEQYELQYDTGKSLLMSLQPTKYLHMLLTSPVLISFETIDTTVKPELKVHVGHAKFLLDINLIKQCLLSGKVESSYFVTISCPVLNCSNGNIGTITLVTSLSSMGETVITEIQQLTPQTFMHSHHVRKIGKSDRNKDQVESLRQIFETHVKELSLAQIKSDTGYRENWVSKEQTGRNRRKKRHCSCD
ncbi:hypothetical protein M8J75_010811 [Diaphorina citri]|nr:hypothetical protein M8J75_010811 [Diaphorina citri]